MKVLIPKFELANLVGKVQNIVSAKPTLPVLGNVLIEALDDELIISATDLTVSMRAYADAKVAEEGAITLPARRFFQLVRELTAPQVELHCKTPESAVLNAGTSHFKLQGMHKSEFPTLPDLTEGAQIEIPNAVIKEMLARTAFAAARDDARQALNGIHLHYAANTATFIGTNGKCVAKIQMPIGLTGEGSSIIPIKAVEEMIKMLDESEKAAKLTLMSDKIALETDSLTLISKLLSGPYPDVTRVIPKKSTHPIVLHREELISLLRQVSLFTSEHSSSVRFSFSSGALHLSAMSGNIGEGIVNMPVNYGGEKLEIAFHPHYFLDILRHCKDESVNLDVTDPYNPGLVFDSTSAEYMIMPMRIDE